MLFRSTLGGGALWRTAFPASPLLAAAAVAVLWILAARLARRDIFRLFARIRAGE